MTSPAELLAALRTAAGGPVAEATEGTSDGAPAVDGLTAPRAEAILAAWTGARLHAGSPGLLWVDDPDARLLIGDWCFAHALGRLAVGADLQAIAALSAAIAAGAATTDGAPANGPQLREIWARTSRELGASG